MKKYLSLFIFMLFTPLIVWAQEVEPSIGEILSGLIKAIGEVKSMGWQVGVSALLAVLISTTKNSLLKQYVWDKLGAFKVMVAPALAMIMVALTVSPFNAKAVLLALVTGAGAIAIHELLDAVKSLPMVGEKWKEIIDVIGKFLGRKTE